MMEAIATNTTFERLGQKLEQLVGDRVGVVCSAITANACDLYPEEHLAVRHAVAKRQREFATGRMNAREAMSRIGESASPIPSGLDRAPIWPRHLSGSISHTDGACIAMVAQRSRSDSIGIDLENDHPMAPDLWSTICTPAEAAYVASLEVPSRGRWVTRLFSAKEAVYKWQYPLTGRMLDFQQIQLNWLPDGAHARFTSTLGGAPALRPPLGLCLLDAGLVVSCVCTT